MKIKAFSKTYQNRCVLSFPEFILQPGKIYAVIGANGSGKSTFAKVLSGSVKADSFVSPFEDASVNVGYLPQKPYAFRMSLIQNLMINASGNKSSSRAKANQLLEQLGLESLSSKQATTLSGGETARMCLARLFMKSYDLLLLDEPCAAMDISSTLQTEKLLRDTVEDTNSTLILITHSLAQARRIADEILFFHEGTLLEYGKTDQVLNEPSKKETSQFLQFFL